MDKRFALSLDDLGKVSGGNLDSGARLDGSTPVTNLKICPECGQPAEQTPLSNGQYKCGACGRVYTPSLLGFEIIKHQ